MRSCSAQAAGASADPSGRLVDAVGQALQLGLHREVEDVGSRIPGGRSTEADLLWADATVRLFDSADRRRETS